MFFRIIMPIQSKNETTERIYRIDPLYGTLENCTNKRMIF